MRPSIKAGRNSLGKKTQSRTAGRGHTAGQAPVPSKRSVSRKMKNRIFHNWLVEENYL